PEANSTPVFSRPIMYSRCCGSTAPICSAVAAPLDHIELLAQHPLRELPDPVFSRRCHDARPTTSTQPGGPMADLGKAYAACREWATAGAAALRLPRTNRRHRAAMPHTRTAGH